MNSNFQFLDAEFSEIYDCAVKAEEYVNTDPRSALICTRNNPELYRRGYIRNQRFFKIQIFSKNVGGNVGENVGEK